MVQISSVFSLIQCFFLSCVTSLKLSNQCPDVNSITPCKCLVSAENEINFNCTDIASLKKLSDIFSLQFPTNELNQIIISESHLDALPDDVFKGKSFKIIRFSANRKTSFQHTKIFSSSQSRLTNLTIIQNTDDWTFDFANIADFSLLSYLEVTGYNVQFTGTLTSPALVAVTLQSYLMSETPKLGKLPALSTLNLDGNVISSLAVNTFSGMPSISNLMLGHNKLTSLGASSLSLVGPIDIVDLSGNIIDNIEKGFITGISPRTSLQLLNNYISQLPKDVFEPIVRSLLGSVDAESGEMLIDGNPLECGCDIAWLVADPRLLNIVSDGRCVNGTRIQKLDPNYFVQNCKID